MTAKRRDHPGNLKEYSSWFGDFQQLGYDRELEIPGTGQKAVRPFHIPLVSGAERSRALDPSSGVPDQQSVGSNPQS